MRVLRRSKSNYSRVGDEVQIRWREGAFESIGGDVSNLVDKIAASNLEKQAREKFLELLDNLTAQGRNVSHSPQAKNNAPKIMVKMPGCNLTQKQIAEAMESLLNEGIIIANAKVGKRSNRADMCGIARTGNSQNGDSNHNDDDCTDAHCGLM